MAVFLVAMPPDVSCSAALLPQHPIASSRSPALPPLSDLCVGGPPLLSILHGLALPKPACWLPSVLARARPLPCLDLSSTPCAAVLAAARARRAMHRGRAGSRKKMGCSRHAGARLVLPLALLVLASCAAPSWAVYTQPANMTTITTTSLNISPGRFAAAWKLVINTANFTWTFAPFRTGVLLSTPTGLYGNAVGLNTTTGSLTFRQGAHD